MKILSEGEREILVREERDRERRKSEDRFTTLGLGIFALMLTTAFCLGLLAGGCDQPEASQAPAEIEGHGNSLLLTIPGGGG